jgi:two-component system CheB/CheR fusion protein
MAAGGRTRKCAATSPPGIAVREKSVRGRRAAALAGAQAQRGQTERDIAAELQHRINNLLATVRVILGQTRDTATTLDDFVEAFDGRLSALARSQMLLTRGLDSYVDLHELLTDELIAHAARIDESVVVSGPKIWLTPTAAEMMAVAFHELATNAVKYGALATPGGRIDVGWRVDSSRAGRQLVLRWREDGVRLERAVAHRGFGTELIEEGLPYTFGGAARLHYRQGGLECVMQFPLRPQHFIVAAGGAT